MISFPSPTKPIKSYTNIELPKTRNGTTFLFIRSYRILKSVFLMYTDNSQANTCILRDTLN